MTDDQIARLFDLLGSLEEQGTVVMSQLAYLTGRVTSMGVQEDRIIASITRFTTDVSAIVVDISQIKDKLTTLAAGVDAAVQKQLSPLADQLSNAVDSLDTATQALSVTAAPSQSSQPS